MDALHLLAFLSVAGYPCQFLNFQPQQQPPLMQLASELGCRLLLEPSLFAQEVPSQAFSSITHTREDRLS